MVPFAGYGGACPDYTVGDARIVNRLRVSCFCLAVTITETGFVTLTALAHVRMDDGDSPREE